MLRYLLFLGSVTPVFGQIAETPVPTVTAQMYEAVHRVEGGHSLTPEELAGAAGATASSKEDLRTAVPLIVQGLGSRDGDLRTYTLTVLQALESEPMATSTSIAEGDATAAKAFAPRPEGSAPIAAVPVGPYTFRAEVGKELTVLVPKIAVHLGDEKQIDRMLAVMVLGGFAPEPPMGVTVALTGYLRREDAIGPVGQAVVEDLLGFGTVPIETALAIGRYLKREDQTPESRAALIDAVAGRGERSTIVNGALLEYLDGGNPEVRARLILSLPQLQLAPELFTEVRARVALIAQNESENLQVITAAKAVTTCWTTMRITAGCPAY